MFVCLFVFDHKACEISAPRPGIKPTSPALEGEVLITGLPGKALVIFKEEGRVIIASASSGVGLPW